MNIRTIALSLTLVAAALAAPPAVSTAHACGGYISTEVLAGRAVTEQVAARWGVTQDKIDILEAALQSDGSVEVDVRVRTGERRAVGRRYRVSHSDRGYSVTVTGVAWLERLTKDGWAHA